MPHSLTSESILADDSSRTMSQFDTVKSEPGTQDIAMEDASAPPEAEKSKVNIEELFDDEDSDDEFPSSAPGIKSEEEPSQPAPLCVPIG